jgi:hypothetical protein
MLQTLNNSSDNVIAIPILMNGMLAGGMANILYVSAYSNSNKGEPIL